MEKQTLIVLLEQAKRDIQALRAELHALRVRNAELHIKADTFELIANALVASN